MMSLTEEVLNARYRGPLYHYTSARGLLGILSSGSIWATHIAYLNDTSEFIHAMDIVQEAVASRLSGSNSERRLYYEAVIEHLRKMNSKISPNIYVTSFCESEDDLSLWRGYCPHNAGYALGYDLTRDTDDIPAITRCVYDGVQKRAIVEEELERFFHSDPNATRAKYEDLVAPAILSDADWRAIDFVFEFYVLAPSFKDSSFKEEREWRLVVMEPIGAPKMERFRPSDTMLIPYVEHSLLSKGSLNIEKIVVGPTQYPRAAAHAIERFLLSWNTSKRQFGIQCNDGIQLSRVPYRRL